MIHIFVVVVGGVSIKMASVKVDDNHTRRECRVFQALRSVVVRSPEFKGTDRAEILSSSSRHG